MKVKFFNSTKHKILEDSINRWFDENPRVKVVSIEQTETTNAGGEQWNISVSIWYKEQA